VSLENQFLTFQDNKVVFIFQEFWP